MSRIVLASQSPRRVEILKSMGYEFDIIPSNIDESKIKASTPSSLVKALSYAKANDVYTKCKDCVVIGADTIVVRHNRIYGKPSSRENAIDMLSSLNNRWHKVLTGVSVITNGKNVCFYATSYVKFKKLTNEDIIRYVDECNPLDKAGAYGIQDRQIVQKYIGSYFNIVGLPKERLAIALARLGVYGDNRIIH